MKILTITFLVGILVLNIVNRWLGLETPAGTLFIIIVVLILHAMSRRAGSAVILRLRGAKELHPSEASWLYGLTKALFSRLRMATPKLHLLPGEDNAAYVLRRSPKHPVVAETEGIDQSRSEITLRRILTRELTRNPNFNRISGVVVAAVAGAIVIYGLLSR